MLLIVSSNAFMKDLKLAKKRGFNLQLVNEAISLLSAGGELPANYKDHMLLGEYNGFRECHIKADYLLIYKIDYELLELYLFRLGTHSDLFE